MSAEERLIAKLGTPVEHHWFEVGGRRLHAVSAGAGPALLLVHGLNVGWGEWFAVWNGLMDSHKVVALDLPGSGASDKVDFLVEDFGQLFIEAIDAALRALLPEGATVVGHSLGGWAALKLAAQSHPLVRSVVAVDPVGFTDFVSWKFRPMALRPVVRFLSRVAVPPTRPNIEMFLGDVMGDRGGLAPEYVDYVFEGIVRPPVSHPFMLIHRLFRPFRFRREFVLKPAEISAISCPLAVIHGAADPLIPLAAVRPAYEGLKRARVTVLEGVGHVPPLECPDKFVSLVNEFAPSL